MSRPTTRADLKAIARRAMLERGLLPDFSPAALAELSALNGHAAETGQACATCAIGCGAPSITIRRAIWISCRSLKPLTGGTTKILVAVADVDAMVTRGSAIDGHAYTNTTTVYTAAEIFSMLPERLSTDLTSLGQGQERLAIVVDMEVAADGVVGRLRHLSCAGLQSREAHLRRRRRLARRRRRNRRACRRCLGSMRSSVYRIASLRSLKGRRHDHGALSLETIESKVVFDGDVLTDLRPDTKNRAKEIIEDFMIAANGATAAYLERRGFASLRRVLRAPERWERIVQLAASLGEDLPGQPDARALEQFLVSRRRTDPARFADLSLSIVKMLGSGEYVVELPGGTGDGHFGLAVKDYTHSTAPNRRFPDLATHRLLKAALAGQPPPYSHDELAALARHCTAQSNNASKVERQVRKSAAARSARVPNR